jgi:hypothetical protein
MKLSTIGLLLASLLGTLLLASLAAAQSSTQAASAVPRLVRFGGSVKDVKGAPLTGVVGVTFALYSQATGGAPLWLETQNITADSNGRYMVLLGATKPEGLPVELFSSEQARWVGAQVAGQAEQSRVLLVSAPYALKAGDADTIGGLPPSAFVLAVPAVANGDGSSSSSSAQAPANGQTAAPDSSSNVTTTGGTANAIPLFTTATNIQNSILTQAATTAVNVGGKLNMPAIGTATATKGFNSQPHDFVASVYNSASKAAVAQTFQFQAEPANNNKSTASSTLNLLFGSGSGTPVETGLSINNKGLFTFATGQTFPGAGTITGVKAGTDLTGGGTTGTVTLSLDTTKVPQLTAANTFTGNQAVTGNLSATGTITATGTVTGGTVASKGSVTAIGDVRVDYNDKNTGSYTPGLRFGGPYSTGEGIASARAGGANQFGLDFYTASTRRMSITNDGLINIGTPVPNTAAQVLSETTLNYALYGESSNSLAAGVLGSATSTTGSAVGVEGITSSTNSDAYGVFGVSEAHSGSAVGVYGATNSPAGVAVFGQHETAESQTGQNIGNFGVSGVGVWGDGGATSGRTFVGVAGTADDGSAAVFLNNSPSGYTTVSINSLGGHAFPLVASGQDGYCLIDSGGSLTCTGSKNAVVPIDGGARTVAMSAIESPVNWFEDAGSARLVNGAAVVRLDRDFIQTVNTDMDYKVFPVPNGDCKGLYVTNKAATSFEVRELGGGTSNVAFDYRIMAVRRNYENVRFADHTHDLDSIKMMEERVNPMGAKPVNHDPTKKVLPLKGNPRTGAAAIRPITGTVKKN